MADLALRIQRRAPRLLKTLYAYAGEVSVAATAESSPRKPRLADAHRVLLEHLARILDRGPTVSAASAEELSAPAYPDGTPARRRTDHVEISAAIRLAVVDLQETAADYGATPGNRGPAYDEVRASRRALLNCIGAELTDRAELHEQLATAQGELRLVCRLARSVPMPAVQMGAAMRIRNRVLAEIAAEEGDAR